MIDWSSGVAAHVQIAAALRSRIENGEYLPGSRLPDRATICETFDVSHVTASNALGLLREAGVVVYKPGRGMFVVSPDRPEPTKC